MKSIANLSGSNQRHLANPLLLIQSILTVTSFLMFQLTGCSQLIESSGRNSHSSSNKIVHVVDEKIANFGDNSQVINGRHRRTTNVTDLRLTADFRAAKLRWIYRLNHNSGDNSNDNNSNQVQVEPASFDIRFCELTTWNVEIKCRHRELFVHKPNLTDNSVIATKPEVAGHNQKLLTVLGRTSDSIEYEAQIFDLRALTNYTFRVKVLRFNDEDIVSRWPSDETERSLGKTKLDRTYSARHLLSVDDGQTTNELVGRIETKPFRAEATKCLADVSEVVITTGKYFGGRITVEDSLDKRCHMIGNKSSEQTSYTFKIDHQICHSKVVKSFTLRASISLPKVNGFSINRPAVITPLNGRPTSKEQPVLLGSMPGIFRAKPLDLAANSTDQLNQSLTSDDLDMAGGNNRNIVKELNETRPRQPKRLKSVNPVSGPRSMDLIRPTDSSSVVPPEPVQISSKLLYVDRHPIASLVAAKIVPTSQVNESTTKPASYKPDLWTGTMDHRRDDPKESEDRLQWRKSVTPVDKTEEEDDEATATIMMTNNHRVAGEFKPTSSLKLDSDSADGLSIKYSAAKVSEYSIGQTTPLDGQTMRKENHRVINDLSTSKRGERTGRMHTVQNQRDPIEGRSTPVMTTDRRMGDMMMVESHGDLLAETSNNNDSIDTTTTTTTTTSKPSSESHWHDNYDDDYDEDDNKGSRASVRHNSATNLAQNLTSYLLNWSLKTLNNLAKKSLESLTNRNDSSSKSASGHESMTDEVKPGAKNSSPVAQDKRMASVADHQRTFRPTIRSEKSENLSASDGFDPHPRPSLQVGHKLPNAALRSIGSASYQVTTSTTARPSVQSSNRSASHSDRASNHSKSLNLDKAESVGSRARSSPVGSINGLGQASSNQAVDYLARSNESGQQPAKESSNHPSVGSSSGSISWLLVGCLLLLALLAGASTIFCLSSSYPLERAASQGIYGQPAACLPKTISGLPHQLVFKGTIVANNTHGQSSETLASHLGILSPSSRRHCYSSSSSSSSSSLSAAAVAARKYDSHYNRFENNLKDASTSSSRVGASLASRNGSTTTASCAGLSTDDDDNTNGPMLGNKQTTTRSAHITNRPPTSDSTARSRDRNADEEADNDENDCTNSELLLDEHILMSSSNSNESYA